MSSDELVQVFTVDGSLNILGQYLWGWQCFACGDEAARWRNASTAREAADQHTALCSSTADLTREAKP